MLQDHIPPSKDRGVTCTFLWGFAKIIGLNRELLKLHFTSIQLWDAAHPLWRRGLPSGARQKAEIREDWLESPYPEGAVISAMLWLKPSKRNGRQRGRSRDWEAPLPYWLIQMVRSLLMGIPFLNLQSHTDGSLPVPARASTKGIHSPAAETPEPCSVSDSLSWRLYCSLLYSNSLPSTPTPPESPFTYFGLYRHIKSCEVCTD